jgi:hypothetical protein
LTADAERHPLPHASDVEKEVGLGRVRTVLPPAHAPSAGAKLSFSLVVSPLPRAAPSAASAPVAPRRLPPPDSRATTWLPLQGSETPS